MIFSLHSKSWLIGKDSDAGRDWGQEEQGATEDEMTGWHHRLDGCECEWTPGVGDGQGGLACCDSWGRKESDTTERLNWTDGSSLFRFLRTLHTVPQWLPQFTFPPTVCKGSLFPTSSPFVICVLFDGQHSDRDEMITLWFWFALRWWLSMWSIFSCAYWPSACSLWKNVQVFCLFSWWSCLVFLMMSCMNYVHILNINPLLVISFANIFSYSAGHLSFC